MKTINKKTLLALMLVVCVSVAFAAVNVKGLIVDALTGYTVGGAAANNTVICGNGTVGTYQGSCGIAVASATTSTTATTATTATNANAVGGVALSGLCQTGGTGCPSSTVPSQTCNANGCYLKFPDGTIQAWGQSAAAVSGGSAQRLAVTFPTPFTTTTNLTVTVSMSGEPAGDGNPHAADCHLSTLPSTTGATATAALSIQVSAGAGYANFAGGETCSWMATGH